MIAWREETDPRAPAIAIRYHRSMKLTPFLLDQWLEQKFAADPPIEYDLGSSTGPGLVNGGDAREFCRGLARHGVLVAPGDCFGMPAHFRIGFAASGSRFGEGLARFSEAVGTAARAFVAG